MTTKLTTLGEEIGVILDRGTLEKSGINAGTCLEVSHDEHGIRIRPVTIDHRTRVLDSAQFMIKAHEETFRKLAE